MNYKDDIRFVKGVGEETAKLYAKLKITKVADLITYYPRRYEDYSKITKVAAIQPGPVTLRVKIISVAARYARRGLHITEALVSDKSGSIKITWFNQPYRSASLKKNTWYFVSGVYEYSGNRYSLVNPSIELVSSFPKNTARIVPIYSETKGLKSHAIRKAVEQLLPIIKTMPETLPHIVIKEARLLSRSEALQQIHFPETVSKLEAAQNRLGFEELYELILASLLNKKANQELQGIPIIFNETLAKKFVNSVEFKLTDAQKMVAWQVLQDLTKREPMNRLVQGDVGSGKTVVAAMAVLMAVKSGLQVAYMAPTEILATQQYQEMGKLLGKFKINTELLLGSMSAKEKKTVHSRIESGEPDVVVGTHALISDHPEFARLGLVVVDEQHRFGVNQREKLLGKAMKVPHVLTMTATPIPRSLALTVFGELDISVINQMPPNRKKVQTKLISPNSRPQLYRDIDKQIQTGRQVYVICPLVEDSDVLGVKSVNEEFKRLNEGPFKHRRISLLHGRLKSQEKELIMKKFSEGKIDILVSTTVVEVGVNIPNASVILIEGAERFGLAQLHQLRGRVRRGTHQPYCYLLPSKAEFIPKRLRMLETTDDGFKLAEYDLANRGPGEIYGARQHGVLDLRMAKISNTKLVALARNLARRTLEEGIDLLQYPQLNSRLNELRKITNLN